MTKTKFELLFNHCVIYVSQQKQSFTIFHSSYKLTASPFLGLPEKKESYDFTLRHSHHVSF